MKTTRTAKTAGLDFTNFDLIILDCDGVIVDTEWVTWSSLAQVLRSHGLPITDQESFDRFLGRALGSVFDEVFPNAKPEGIYEEFVAIQFPRLAAATTKIEGIDELLDFLDSLGLPFCVASGATAAKMRVTLGAVGLYERFADAMFSSEDVGRSKPAPDVFLFAAAAFNTGPSRCLVIEDSPVGIDAARAAAMSVVGLACSASARRTLSKADLIVDSLTELIPDHQP